jgi:NAD(P)-dependent dehydrogenase (short-subunit alcohol dehydrogenase family)
MPGQTSQDPPPPQSTALKGKVAVVTGASSGLGARFVRALVAAGAAVVATARREERLAELSHELGADAVHPVAGDICDPAFPALLMGAATERFGHLDVLVNNAGISQVAPAEEMSTEDFLRVLQVNLVALFACCREAYGPMRDCGGGSIVNISSALGLVGLGRVPQASYSASKGGVIAVSRELAAQWAGARVRVNCIAPGWFPTELTEPLLDNERGVKFVERLVPLGRVGRIEELDGIAVFLAGDASSYVTGQAIAVDGGWTSV